MKRIPYRNKITSYCFPNAVFRKANILAFDTLYTVLLEFSKIAAPFIPFTTECIYKHMTGESVHLADWPEEKSSRIDMKLTKDILKVRTVIEGIRRIREKEKTKLRQPLPLVRVHGMEKNTLGSYAHLIQEQGNVKETIYEETAQQFAKPEIQLNAKELGPILKKEMKNVKAAVSKGQYETIGNGNLKVGNHVIENKHYSTQWAAQKADEIAMSENDVVISVSFQITEELKVEGISRELNRLIQDLRKQIQLSYDQKIKLAVKATGDWQKGFETHKQWLMEQSLALEASNDITESMITKDDDRGKLEIQIIPA